IALLLPAVQQAREAGRRLSCISNIRQLAIAVQSYNNAHGLLPASGIVAPMTRQWNTTNDVINYPVFNQRSGKMFSWAVLLLPYMEEQNLYDKFDMSVSVLEQPREPQRTSLAALLCPSDGAQNRFYMDEDFSGGKWFAKGNYAAYDSPMHGDLQMLYP